MRKPDKKCSQQLQNRKDKGSRLKRDPPKSNKTTDGAVARDIRRFQKNCLVSGQQPLLYSQTAAEGEDLLPLRE